MSCIKTGEKIFKALSNILENFCFIFDNYVSVIKYGAKIMIGSQIRLIGIVNAKAYELNDSSAIWVNCIVHQQALCEKF